MLVCVIPLAPGPSIAKQTKVLEENVIGKYTNLFGASNPHCIYQPTVGNVCYKCRTREK